MTEPRPLPAPEREPGLSLTDRALSWRPAFPRISRRAVAIAAVALLVLLSLVLILASLPNRQRAPATAPRKAGTTAPAPSLSATLAAISRTLPDIARLAEAAQADRLTLVVETAEPDRLRAALAADAALSNLRTTGEAALADGGYRVMLEGPAGTTAAPATGPRPDAGRVPPTARQHRLLVERLTSAGLAVSGREADVREFVATLENGRPAMLMSRWKMTALPDGAVRLEARIDGASRPAIIGPIDPRTLFATAAPVPVATDAPELAGIVGRLPDEAVALVRGADGRAVSVAIGGEAPGGWRLAALSADAAIFTRGGERARVPLPAK